METLKKQIYSIFSGTFYEIPEKDIKILDVGQVPLSKLPPSNCKKCFGRGYIGRDKDNFAYYACSCVKKLVSLNETASDLIKKSSD
jgi:hypothetical protein